MQEFKEFALRGNMFDMAIGIIIGASFNKIVNSLVDDVIMPPIGFIIGGVNIKDLRMIFSPEVVDPSGVIVKEMVALNYGAFIQVMFDFSIIAFTVFVVIKVFNVLRKKAEDINEPDVPTPKDIELLSEIRDILKEQNS